MINMRLGDRTVVPVLVLSIVAGCVAPPTTTQTAGGSSTANAYRGHVVSGRNTAMQKAIGQCAVSLAAGVIIGHIIDSNKAKNKEKKKSHSSKKNSHGDNKATRAGLALGGVACVALIAVAHEKDRARIAAEEAEVARTNQSRTMTFKTQSGSTAQVRTAVKPAPTPTLPPTPTPVKAAAATPKFEPTVQATASNVSNCRYTQQTITVDGSTSAAPPQVWCRVGGDEYVAMAG